MDFFVTKLFEDPALYTATVASFMLSICFHEFAHAFVAHKLGDNTAKDSGYMTLNPFKVMGWMSIAALLLFGFSWGAVPVRKDDPNRLRRSAISLTGPLSNLLLLFTISFIMACAYSGNPKFGTSGGVMGWLAGFLITMLFSNAVLFLFNILPIPQLDGWETLEAFFPNCMKPSPAFKQKAFHLLIYLCCFSSASGFFDKGVELFTNRFLPVEIRGRMSVNVGDECFGKGDYAGAFKAFSEAAAMGYPEGKMLVAFCQVEGYGCKQDFAAAFEGFSEEDVREHTMSKFYLGLMQLNGMGCKQDYGKALALFSDPDVLREFPHARSNLVMMYAEGMGVKPNMAKAYELVNDEECLKVSPSGRFYMGVFLLGGEVCPKDATRAFTLLNDPAVKDEIPAANFFLGICYYSGEGTKQDFKKAAEHLKAAADAGNADAAQFLGYENGKLPETGRPLEELLKLHWESNK